MAAIKIQHALKTFGATTVLDDVNLSINDGEMFALLGPSGCGKTTTLRAIAGLESFDQGEISLGDRRIDHLTPGERDIAFVFQLYTLYPHLSVNDNISFPLRAAGVATGDIERRVKEVAQLLRISALLNLKPSKLSGGDMQRVTIARALVRNPAALLMDEPLGALDAKLREDMRTELAHLHAKRGVTSVLVTHDQVEAMSLANRMAVMHDGRVQQVGTASEVYEHPDNLFVAQFIGAPTINVFEANLIKANNDDISIKLLECPGSLLLSAPMQATLKNQNQTQVKVGIRPEAIAVLAPENHGLPARLTQYEPLGSFDLVSFTVSGGTVLRAKTKTRSFRDVGAPVVLKIEPESCHLFDVKTGRSLFTNHPRTHSS
jgi:multiple sugar transport system ATP-binding protein